ncbi:MAG TPA: hypothetical protein VFO01_14030 [Trebonia sp.]|nr:hypothetical protein [Trebonia sp.]
MLTWDQAKLRPGPEQPWQLRAKRTRPCTAFALRPALPVASGVDPVLVCTVAAHLQTVRRHHARQLRKARESLDIFAPVAAQLSMDTIKAELETLAYATMTRNRHAHSASGRQLVAMAALLPAATRTPLVRGMARRPAHAARPVTRC